MRVLETLDRFCLPKIFDPRAGALPFRSCPSRLSLFEEGLKRNPHNSRSHNSFRLDVTASNVLFLGVVLGSVAALALLLLLDYRYHKLKPHELPPTRVEIQPSKMAVPLALPKPEPLPKLEPLAFMDVLRRSLKDYRENLVLVVPFLIQYIQSWASYAVSSRYPSQSPSMPNPLLLLNGLISLVVVFAAYLGQISLTAAAVGRGKAALRDWSDGFKYFWTFLAFLIVFGLLLVGPELGTGLLYQQIKPHSATIAYATYYLVTIPILATGQSILFVCFAAMGLDRKGFATSLDMGWRAMWARRSAFAGLVIISIAVQGAIDVAAFLTAPILEGALKNLIFVFPLVQIIVFPLWFLIAFRIYRGFNEPNAALTQPELSKPQEDSSRVITRKQFCIQCGAELPIGSKFCLKCGSKQVG